MSLCEKTDLINARNRILRAENVLCLAWVDLSHEAELSDRVNKIRSELDSLSQDLSKKISAMNETIA